MSRGWPAAGPTRTGRGSLAAAAAGMVLLALAGCAGPGSPPVAQVAVTAEGFSPAALTVTAGTEVRWVSQVPTRVSVTSLQTTGTDPADPAPATFVAQGQQFDSGPLDEGEVYAVQLDAPGQYLYRSSYQDDPNWVGAITVEAP